MLEGVRPDRPAPPTEQAAELAPVLPLARRASPAWGPLAWLLVGALALAMLLLLRTALRPFVAGALLAYVVAPAVDWLHRRARMPRSLSILSVYACLALILAVGIAVVLPDILGELQRFLRLLPGYGAAMEGSVARLSTGYRRLPLPPLVRQAADGAIVRAQAGVAATLRAAMVGAVGMLQFGFAAVVAPVLAYYLLADSAAIRAGLAALLPPSARQATLSCLTDLDAVLAGWIRGQLLLAAAVGTLATLALLLLRVRFALTLGLIAGVGELIPYFGPVLGAVPALATAATEGGATLVLATAGSFLLIQQLESAFLAPRLIGGSVGLHPLVVIGALLVGERWGGLPGVLLAVPAAACVRVLGRHAWRALTAVRRPRSLT